LVSTEQLAEWQRGGGISLIDGYFSVAMAVNTRGTQRRARLLKATQDFNAAASRGLVP
jgi:hypothetical protein